MNAAAAGGKRMATYRTDGRGSTRHISVIPNRSPPQAHGTHENEDDIASADHIDYEDGLLEGD